MTGIVLAGGRGTRLAPLTDYVNKSILLVGTLPMIAYPIRTLIDSGIRKLIIVLGPSFGNQIREVVSRLDLGDVEVKFTIQHNYLGIPAAISTAKDMVQGDSIVVVAGDNIFGGNYAEEISRFESGCVSFLRNVSDPGRFAVARFNDSGKVVEVIEKPKNLAAGRAICGPHIFDNRVFKMIETLHPSDRGELEIVDLYRLYMKTDSFHLIEADDYWNDMGTPEALAEVSYHVIKNQDKFK